MRSKVGWVISVLPSLLLLFSGFNKIMASEEVLSGLSHFGINPDHIKALGIVEILITLLYLIPRTSFIGAILINARFQLEFLWVHPLIILPFGYFYVSLWTIFIWFCCKIRLLE